MLQRICEHIEAHIEEKISVAPWRHWQGFRRHIALAPSGIPPECRGIPMYCGGGLEGAELMLRNTQMALSLDRGGNGVCCLVSPLA